MRTNESDSTQRLPATYWTGLVLRELLGWLLLLLGLYVFRLSVVDYFNRALAIEGIVVAVIGVFLFRGGLQLIKVCVAARAVP